MTGISETELVRKSLERDILLLIRVVSIEYELNKKRITSMMTKSFEAHGYNAIREQMIAASIQIISRMSDRSEKKIGTDRASFFRIQSILSNNETDEFRRFASTVERLQKLRNPIHEYRHKYIAHSLTSEVSKELTYENLDSFIEGIKECFINMERVFGRNYDLSEIEKIERKYALHFARTLWRGMRVTREKFVQRG